MYRAKGNSINQYYKDLSYAIFHKDQAILSRNSTNIKKANKYLQATKESFSMAMIKAGQALGTLHATFASPLTVGSIENLRTYIHGDAHWENIFYEESEHGEGQIFLIDNSRFAYSLQKKKSIDYDLIMCIIRPILGFFSRNLSIHPESISFTRGFKLFLMSYVEQYPPEIQDNVKEYIISIMERLMTKSKDFIEDSSRISKSNEEEISQTFSNIALSINQKCKSQNDAQACFQIQKIEKLLQGEIEEEGRTYSLSEYFFPLM